MQFSNHKVPEYIFCLNYGTLLQYIFVNFTPTFHKIKKLRIMTSCKFWTSVISHYHMALLLPSANERSRSRICECGVIMAMRVLKESLRTTMSCESVFFGTLTDSVVCASTGQYARRSCRRFKALMPARFLQR